MSNVLRVYEFLKEFNKLKNKTVLRIDEHPRNIKLNDLKVSEYLNLDLSSDDIILQVRPVQLLGEIQTPEELVPWLEVGYNDWQQENVQIRRSIILENQNGLSYEAKLEDHEDIFEKFTEWEELRNKWVAENKKRFEVKRLYNELISIQKQIENESETYEAVIGVNMLIVESKEVRIEHPLFSQKVQVIDDFSNNLVAVSFDESYDQADFNSALLRVFAQFKPTIIRQISEEIEEHGYSINDNDNLDALSDLVQNSLLNILEGSRVSIEKESYLYVRKRNQGYAKFIESIIEDLESNDEIQVPQFMLNLLYHSDDSVVESTEKIETIFNGIDNEVLLTLPANDEQLRIMKILEKHGAVLVQGPPGTGKTHTIANLVGHLLSVGKTVLVTSQTEKALSVLKEKVFMDENYDLRSLCINLSKDKSQRLEMDNAISSISEMQSTFDELYYQKNISYLQTKRLALISELHDLKAKYLRLKKLENTDFVYNGEQIRPIDAAKFIAEGAKKYDYLDLKTSDSSAGFPLDYNELKRLYFINSLISKNDEWIIKNRFMEIDWLLSPDKFSNLVYEIVSFKPTINTDKGKDFDFKLLDEKRDIIESIINRLESIEEYSIFFMTTRTNGPLAKVIVETLKKTLEIIAQYEEYKTTKYRTKTIINSDLLTKDLVSEINKLAAKGSRNAFSGVNSLFKSRKRILEAINTNLDLNKAEDLITISELIDFEERLENNKSDLIDYFREVGSFDFDFDNFHNQQSSVLHIIEAVEMGFTISEDVKILFRPKKLEEVQTTKDNYYNRLLQELKNLLDEVTNTLDFNRFTINNNKLSEYVTNLKQFAKESESISILLKAVVNKDVEVYKDSYQTLVSIIQKKELLEEREVLLNRIENYSLDLSKQISAKIGVHSSSEVPDYFQDAWKRSQLNQQLDELNEENRENIRDQIKITNERILKNAQELAHYKAWKNSLERLSPDQKKNIAAWKLIIRKIGAGKGKKAPKLKREAREVMTKTQEAIPVWIMPLAQVVDTFDPRSNKFDVIIIDEASQADLLSLSALYLGKQVIIVGDDKQVSPSLIGIKDDTLEHLQRQYLSNIPNFSLFDEKRSLYDLAMLGSFKQVLLREHFRCYPDIISFSNKMYYNNRIEPLRDPSNEKILPSVVEYRVSNGYRDKNTRYNENEANTTVALICSMIDHEEYRNKSIGVISMVGHEHSEKILNKLIDRVGNEEIKKRKIICGSPYQFQGDERDIILINLVDSTETARLVASGSLDGKHDKEYNVAISRAKDQLWLVHSFNSETDLKQEDLRYKLIQHIRNPKVIVDQALINKAESVFEMEVMQSLLEKGYRIIPQFHVAGYRIDMVVFDGNRKVALECDGEAYHTSENADADLSRQMQLERLGWSFIRIRGSFYYSNKVAAMEHIVQQLNAKQIYPSKVENNFAQVESSLLESVKQKALTHMVRKEKQFEGYFEKPERPLVIDKSNALRRDHSPIEIEKSYKSETKVTSNNFAQEDKYKSRLEIERQKSELLTNKHRADQLPVGLDSIELEKKLISKDLFNKDLVIDNSTYHYPRVGDLIFDNSFGFGKLLSYKGSEYAIKFFASRSIRVFQTLKGIHILNKEKVYKLVLDILAN